MLTLLPRNIEAYLAKRASHKDTVLRKMEQKADREGFPIVGPQVGQMLLLMARSINATRIFEMGSGFGYSALWFAKALPASGCVTLTETASTRSLEAEAFFRKARKKSNAQFLIGDAIELIAKEQGQFDVIFLDADKARYPLAFKVALPKLRRGGLFIADNVLWSGQVAEPSPDADARGILEFTDLIFGTRGITSSIIPLRDGVSISLKNT